MGSRPHYSRPRYAAALLTLLGACFLAYFAYMLRVIDCSEDTQSVCSTGGLAQLLLALSGLIPALGMMVQAVRGRGGVGLWFAATVLVYVTWGMCLWLVGETA